MIKGDISNVSAPELWIEAEILYGKSGNWVFLKFEYQKGALEWITKMSRTYNLIAFSFEKKNEAKIRRMLEDRMEIQITDELEMNRKLDRSDNIAKVYVTKETKKKFQADDRVIGFNGWGDR